MSFKKGVSGNPNGRRKQTEEEKQQREKFKALLSTSTVTALENIIQIANDKRHKDRFKACAYIVDKAYGNMAFLLDGTEKESAVIIRVVPGGNDNDDFEEDWNEE